MRSDVGKPQPEPRSLLHLPLDWLHSMVYGLDARSRRQFFFASQGGLEDNRGCATILFRTCKVKVTRMLSNKQVLKPEGPRSTLKLAAEMSIEMSIIVHGGGRLMSDILSTLSTSEDGQLVLGPFPKVAHLDIKNFRSLRLIPEELPAAFPQLHTLALRDWHMCALPEDGQPPAVTTQGLDQVKNLLLFVPSNFHDHPLWPSAVQHVRAQLQYLPGVTHLGLNDDMLEVTPVNTLQQLTELEIAANVYPTETAMAALAKCRQLQTFRVTGSSVAAYWVCLLPEHVPHITVLDAKSIEMTDATARAALKLPELAHVSFSSLHTLEANHSQVPGVWRSLRFAVSCSSHITKLPLDTLDSPVECSEFWLRPSLDHVSDLAAFTAAKPHLERCGGIRIKSGVLVVTSCSRRFIHAKDAQELLRTWAPLMTRPTKVIAYGPGAADLYTSAVTALWPDVPIKAVDI